jgi:hypothetical protein
MPRQIDKSNVKHPEHPWKGIVGAKKALAEYQETRDIIRLQRQLGHKHIKSTMALLEGPSYWEFRRKIQC